MDTSVMKCILILFHAHSVMGQVLMQNIDSIHQIAGSDATLNCIAYGLKDSKVSWQRYTSQRTMEVISVHDDVVTLNPKLPDGREKYEINAVQLTNRQWLFALTVRHLVADDAGTYQCFIMKMGLAAVSWPRVNGTVQVQYPPVIREGYTSSWVDVAENGTTVLNCEAAGIPEPRISWVRANGQPFKDGRLVKEGKKLHLSDVTEDDRGVYRCRAVNNVRPSATVDIMVDVHFRPRVTAFRRHVGQRAGMNLEAELSCIASGQPQPVLSWYKVISPVLRQEILNDEAHRVQVSYAVLVPPKIRDGDRWFTLRILNVQDDDFAIYECEARNIYGTTSTAIKLFQTTTCQGRGCMWRLGNNHAIDAIKHGGNSATQRSPSVLTGAVLLLSISTVMVAWNRF